MWGSVVVYWWWCWCFRVFFVVIVAGGVVWLVVVKGNGPVEGDVGYFQDSGEVGVEGFGLVGV